MFAMQKVTYQMLKALHMCWIDSNSILEAQLCFYKFLFIFMDQSSLKQQTEINYDYECSKKHTV
jgi:hypothetical protein